ncbi:MAG: glycerate kinase [Clostridia bacterium]|nr:glycerate kinase [Clostridia bacterium]
MKKFVIIPDSFKGTISSTEICSVIERKISEVFPNAKTVCLPVADGGEGTVDCFLTALGGKKINISCTGPLFEKMNGFYGVLNDNTAVIEMAAVAGLPLVENCKDPKKTTTYGVGELIMHAIKSDCKNIILGLGGSATNDYGTGAAAALGVKFFDASGKEFIPTGGTLVNVAKIDVSKAKENLKGIKITAMCDIDNPPYGKNGAAYVYAPQKGADEKTVEQLDLGLKSISLVIEKQLKINVSNLKGGGAAGAMGAGAVAFLGAQLKMGINTVLETVNFSQLISDADLIFTGEGKIDSQSLMGKVVIGVSQKAKEQNVPVIAIVGGAEGDLQGAYEMGVTSIFTINRLPQDFSVSRYKTKENLEFCVENVLRFLKSTRQKG